MPGDRRSIRLSSHDYAAPAYYFFTILTYKRRMLLGRVSNGRVLLSSVGLIVDEEWRRTGAIRPEIQLDEFVIMPNHVHGIVQIRPRSGMKLQGGQQGVVRATGRSPLPAKGPPAGSLGALIGALKAAVTRRSRELTGRSELLIWHRNYYERVIRNERELEAHRRYIRDNFRSWEHDRHSGSS